MTSSGQPYQGYPYLNVSFNDAPSVDPTTAKQWAHLPVRPNRKGGVRSPLDDDRRPRNTNNSNNQLTPKKNIDEYPVVYIDIPSREDSAGSEPQTPSEEGRVHCTVTPEVIQNTNDRFNQSPKKNIEDHPVVYIDIPSPEDNAGSEPQTTVEDSRGQMTIKPELIQDTVYFNPYDDTQPSVGSRNDPGIQSISTDPGNSSSRLTHRVPPNTLNLSSAGSSSAAWNDAPPSTLHSPPQVANPYPPYMSKEAQIYSPSYSRPQPDGFQFEPIPVAEFPAPPPAYSEVDQSQVVVETPPGPTQVIVTPTTGTQPNIIPVNPDRKILVCSHCGARVYSLVIRQNGCMTHTTACILLSFCLLPFLYLVYCKNCCKYKNHYCPNCNQLIGYEACCRSTVK